MTVDEFHVKISADTKEIRAALGRLETKTKQSGNKMTQSLGRIGGAFAAAFSVQALIGVSRELVHIRSEFERFEAVLSNTLGSRGAAVAILDDIKTMATETPFSVAMLSDAFVKLTNYGLRPSMEEMRLLGDVASATGKPFMQLAEAIADATTGQFERLKEFGIKASKEGDKVSFTFKGVTTEVNYSNDAIRDYITGLGNLDGVAGSMEVQMDTLGGAVSNFGDAWDSFLVALGESPMWEKAIRKATELLGVLEKMVSPDDTPQRRLAKQISLAAEEGFLPTKGQDPFAYAMGGGDVFLYESGRAAKSINEMTEAFEENGMLMVNFQTYFSEYLDRFQQHVDGIVDNIADAEKEAADAARLARKAAVDQYLASLAAEATKENQEKLEKQQQEKLRGEMPGLSDRWKKPVIESDAPTTWGDWRKRKAEDLKKEQEREEAAAAASNEFIIGQTSILADGLMTAAGDMENAGEILTNALAQIVANIVEQALIAQGGQLGSFAGPIGTIVGRGIGLLGTYIRGDDIEVSRSRSVSSTTRFG